jgi:hypothetical protein
MEDFDATAQAISKNGRQIALEKFAVPRSCWQGYFLDLERTMHLESLRSTKRQIAAAQRIKSSWDRDLHGEHGTEARLAFRNALISLRSIRQRVGLNDRFHFPLRHVIQRFIQILGAVLLAADHLNALCD